MTDHATLTAALAAAQDEFPPIPKNREVNAGARKYKYAELATILSAVTPVLAKNGLAVTQRMDVTEHGTVLVTDLRHTGGEVVSSCLPLHMDGLQPQALGSLLTYLKRYSLTSLLNVAADEDDDAQIAQDEHKHQPPRQTRQPQRQPPARSASPQDEVERALGAKVTPMQRPAEDTDPWRLGSIPAEDVAATMIAAIKARPWLEVQAAAKLYKGRLTLTEHELVQVREAMAVRHEDEKQMNLLAAG